MPFIGHRTKIFLAEIGQKFGIPPVINQVARLEQFLQSYPSILVDKELDYGQSIIDYRPYLKAILARVTTNDGRSFALEFEFPQEAAEMYAYPICCSRMK